MLRPKPEMCRKQEKSELTTIFSAFVVSWVSLMYFLQIVLFSCQWAIQLQPPPTCHITSTGRRAFRRLSGHSPGFVLALRCLFNQCRWRTESPKRFFNKIRAGGGGKGGEAS